MVWWCSNDSRIYRGKRSKLGIVAWKTRIDIVKMLTTAAISKHRHHRPPPMFIVVIVVRPNSIKENVNERVTYQSNVHTIYFSTSLTLRGVGYLISVVEERKENEIKWKQSVRCDDSRLYVSMEYVNSYCWLLLLFLLHSFSSSSLLHSSKMDKKKLPNFILLVLCADVRATVANGEFEYK